MIKPFEDDDPMELKGVEVDAEEECMTEMTRAFMDEFVRTGYSDDEILRMFRLPIYHGPHMVHRAKGPGYVKEMLNEARDRWQPLSYEGDRS
ncbi:MAG: hypothetical protein HUU60_03605 [Armatimonadetes bacterium]|nr:hypothetical protein [Armatimonadota bacterium]